MTKIVKKKPAELLITEKNYILSSWLRAYRNSYEAFAIDKEHYFFYFKEIVVEILEKSEIYFCYELSSLISGWLVREARVLHFIYIKNNQRNKGLAKLLVAEGGGFNKFTFFNKDFKNWNKNQAIYTPFFRHL